MDRGLVAIATIVTIVTTIAATVPNITVCPDECICDTRNNVTTISCTDRALSGLPEDLQVTVNNLDFSGNVLSSLVNVFKKFTQLQSLDVSGNNIEHLSNADFSYNIELTNLNLANNYVSNISSATFSLLNKLEQLDLSGNSLEQVNSAMFDGLDLLEELNLGGNKLSNISEATFSTTPSLMTIDLSHNYIDHIPENTFATNSSVQILDISYNQITVLDGQILQPLETLRRLNVSYNDIKNMTQVSLPLLDTLDLSWNNLSSITTDMFTYLPNLTELILDGNQLTTIQDTVFEQLTHLETLSLSYMPRLTYLSKEAFKGLGHLTVLKMHHNPQLSFIHKELFVPLPLLSIMDIRENHIETLHNATLQACPLLSALDIQGNMLACDCDIEWLVKELVANDSIIQAKDSVTCVMPNANLTVSLQNVQLDLLHCSDLMIVNHSGDGAFKIGSSVILTCVVESHPSAEIIWITPRNHVLKYHKYHPLAALDYRPVDDQSVHTSYHASHEWHTETSYYSESVSREDRIIVLADGSLYIDYVMRTDAGAYRCIARNPRNETEIVINIKLDYLIIYEVKTWTFIVGFGCAGAFFLLNLIYSFTLAGIRRCISKQRRKRIRQIIESMDTYKTARLARIKENYNEQVGKIRDQYHYQLGRLREHHQNQANRLKGMRDGASNRVDRLKENYNNQLGRLKDYSSSQLVQIREKYNNQIDKIKDYGNYKMDRLHQKYKIKQQHVTKILEMMNLENCRTTFESECVRTESMILQSDIFTTDVPINNPLDSLSISDDEYLTATSSEHSRYTSRENVNGESRFEHLGHPINPYIPDSDEDEDSYEQEFSVASVSEAGSSRAPNTKEEERTCELDPLCQKGQGEGQTSRNSVSHVEPSTSKRSSRRKHGKKHRPPNKGHTWRKSDPVLSTFSDDDADFSELLAQSERPRSMGDKMDVHKSGTKQQQQPQQQTGNGDNPGHVIVDIQDCSGTVMITETNL